MIHHRPHLSYSAMVLFEQSPEAFIDYYVHGIKRGTNRGMALGKEIAEALEHDKETGDIVNDLVIAQIPKYELRDKEILVDFKVGKDEVVPLLIKPDFCKADYSAFIELKTGDEKYPWTQKKVNANDQITFYTTGLLIKSGRIPTSELIWAPSRRIEGADGILRPELTGEIKRFSTKRTLVDVLRMKARMARVWREIGKLMEEQII